jgi:esterase/lipase
LETSPQNGPWLQEVWGFFTGGGLAALLVYLISHKKVSVEEKKVIGATQESLIQDLVAQVKNGWEMTKELQARCDRQQEQLVLYQQQIMETKAQLTDQANAYQMLLERYDPEKTCHRTDCPNRLRE